MKLLLTLLLSCISVIGLRAQDLTVLAMGAVKLNRHLFTLCARTNFSVAVRGEILAAAGEHRLTMPFHFFSADGMSRQEILLGEMADLPPEARRGFKQIGIETLSVVVRPDEAKVYVSVNRLHAYCELPIPEDLLRDPLGKEFKFQETAIGTEEIGGQECAKAQFIELTHPNEVATIWRSQALGGFPLKVEMRSPNLSGMNFSFTNVDLRKPPAAYFSIPTNYVKLPDAKSFIPYALELMKRQSAQSPNQQAPGKAGQ